LARHVPGLEHRRNIGNFVTALEDRKTRVGGLLTGHEERGMDVQDSVYLARSLYEFWNHRELEKLAGLVATDCEILVAGSGERFKGPPGAIESSRIWADAFPDGRVEVDHIIAAGDFVAVELTAKGTHTGVLRSSTGTIPATGRSITLDICDVVEIRGEKIQTIRSYLDSGSLLMQLGFISASGTTTRLRT
jgi:predicted ester cyclase